MFLSLFYFIYWLLKNENMIFLNINFINNKGFACSLLREIFFIFIPFNSPMIHQPRMDALAFLML